MEAMRYFQCPGCFSVSGFLAKDDPSVYYECECGEKLTLIDLRGPVADPLPATQEEFDDRN